METGGGMTATQGSGVFKCSGLDFPKCGNSEPGLHRYVSLKVPQRTLDTKV